jgi:hypothetical protein
VGAVALLPKPLAGGMRRRRGRRRRRERERKREVY